MELAPDEPETPAVTEPAEPATPEQTAAERDEAGKFKAKGSGKPRNDPQARVQQATAKEAAAKEEARKHQERADRLERELADARRAQPQAQPAQPQARPQAKPDDGKPTWGAFEAKIGSDYQTWGEAQDAYFEAQHAYRDDQGEWKAALGEIERARATDPEFDRLLKNELPCSAVMGRAIRDSKQRLDIMRYLGTHPEMCAQLAQESDRASLDAAPVMRRYLEAQVMAGAAARPDSAPAVRPSTANPPINRVGGTATATPLDPDELPFGPDYIRAENARERKRQEASRW